jgi:hypothetical protein
MTDMLRIDLVSTEVSYVMEITYVELRKKQPSMARISSKLGCDGGILDLCDGAVSSSRGVGVKGDLDA